ncbi:TetR/AcrR family transcriptional regulator C-terminal domain-containing protein [Aetokthonos hydrillicola Thurmond2011]|jgi:AcrR family transcriptional regulator|uniref:TetR/AcrR family transcriptional regulator C-terminal domain-containing protein n=3 Tax=Aetokthonos TaxID=1550243 RepID=A0AAP5I341_9CYAN|nr:TetR/AcrR family transcriptional regulator [Aetokthonos hydrillicola CCALA 1050]MBW4585022.1 TetR/AcrR family transcriptional regulator C-terminal domain-containing protein [Aetokthonos hydrillicola CCALA 1050]MDR9894217.1 TetR/AcrR family transcriptional regulator C-terminal domain-containing protein [Aetokthonos hydrillicola Thurmond2011]
MPLRDEQSFEGRRQQIIDGALEVFASKGFEKATNKDIATASGIRSPGLIYHYFKDKNDLLQQVIEQRLPVLQLLSHREEEIMTKPPEDALTIFAKAFLQALEAPKSLALMKVLLSEAFRQPSIAEIINKIGPSRSIAFLTRYLEKQISAGVMKPIDTGAAARCFVGSLIAYIITREVFLQPDVQRISAATMVATAVEVFLRGLETSQPEALNSLTDRHSHNLPKDRLLYSVTGSTHDKQ